MSEEVRIDNDWMPLYLSCIAGASTCLGAGFVFCHPKTANNTRVVSANTMSFSLALAGSVMITVSVISIGPECLQDPGVEQGFQIMKLNSYVFLQRMVSFGLGCIMYYVISLSFPEPDQVLGLKPLNDEEGDLEVAKDGTQSSKVDVESRKIRSRRKSTISDQDGTGDGSSVGSAEDLTDALLVVTEIQPEEYSSKDKNTSWKHWSAGTDLENADQRRAWRVAMLLFVSLLCHNFPEGLAVAASALESRKLGIAVTIGIMIHNIPEGIAIAIPCLAARPDMPFLAFALASLSGIAEPLGAIVALFCLRNVSKSSTSLLCMENVLAFVAGIMITVALYELFPEANRHTSQGKAALIGGTVAGVLVMVATELYVT